MSNDTTTPIDDTTTSRETTRSEFVEAYREPLFVLTLLLGIVVFSFGLALFIVSVGMDATPPAPYFASSTDKWIAVGASVVLILVGGGIGRGAFRIGGW